MTLTFDIYVATKEDQKQTYIFEAYSIIDNNPIGYHCTIYSDNNRPFKYDNSAFQTFNWALNGYTIREATQEEINWLVVCKNHNRMVEKPKEKLFPIF